MIAGLAIWQGVSGIARRVVLTGGASQLHGTREFAALILDKQVRMGRPQRVAGLAEATGGPAFATTAGLLHFALSERAEVSRVRRRPQGSRSDPPKGRAGFGWPTGQAIGLSGERSRALRVVARAIRSSPWGWVLLRWPEQGYIQPECRPARHSSSVQNQR